MALAQATSARIPLADGTVHCAVTSPPYWGLRKYAGSFGMLWPSVTFAPMPGMVPITIPGCDPNCDHVWGEEQPPHHPGQVEQTKWKNAEAAGKGQTAGSGQWCQRCGGWRGELGLEPTPEMFIGHIVLIMREVWRVLRDDGTVWLNFGDSYYSDFGGGSSTMTTGNAKAVKIMGRRNKPDHPGLKKKDLCGIPWRVAFALQADGWYLRSDIIWAKGVSFCDTYSGSCMPESCRDRPTKGHEYLFLLSKRPRYFYDIDAVREPSVTEGAGQHFRNSDRYVDQGEAPDNSAHHGDIGSADGYDPSGRNIRTVWAINPAGYKGAHYATFPPDLVVPCVRAGTSQHGVCPECGAPWERVVERESYPGADTRTPGEHTPVGDGKLSGSATQKWLNEHPPQTVGWQPTCDHDAEPVPATVLDPFCGSGTVGEVCRTLPHPRRFVGLDISAEYLRDHALVRAENTESDRSLAQLPMFQLSSQ